MIENIKSKLRSTVIMFFYISFLLVSTVVSESEDRMPNIPSINIGGTSYDVKDADARRQLEYIIDRSVDVISFEDASGFQPYWYGLENNIITKNSSSGWKSTSFLDVRTVKRVTTHVDNPNQKPCVMYFSATNIQSYIGCEIGNANGDFNADITPPSGAKYCIIQCLASEASGKSYEHYYPSTDMVTKYDYDHFVDDVVHLYLVDFSTKNIGFDDASQFHPYWYGLENNIVTKNYSSAWISTSFLDVRTVKHVKTYVDNPDQKPCILYFSATDIDCYLGCEKADSTNIFNADITPPSGAKYCIIQCLASEASGKSYDINVPNYKFLSDEKDSGYINVAELSHMVESDGSWSKAIQYALDNYHDIYIPAKDTPYFLNNRLLIGSNTHLKVSEGAIIYIMDDANTCFIRNRNAFSDSKDHDIEIEGGVWYGNYANQHYYDNGAYCNSDKINPIRGISGMISMSGVSHFKVHDLTMKECKSFGMQITSCDNFEVYNILFDEMKRDGVHCTGDCTDFHVHDIHGKTGDDFIALNAWDWYYSTNRNGTIKNGIIENLFIDPEGSPIRILSGEENGENYIIDNISIRNVFGNCQIQISHQDDLETPSHVSGRGYVGKIFVENVFHAALTSAVWIYNTDVELLSICNANLISNADLLIDAESTATIKRLNVDGYHFNTASDGKGQIRLYTIPNMIMLNNIWYECAVKNTDGDGVLVLNGDGAARVLLSNSQFIRCGSVIHALSPNLDKLNATIRNTIIDNVQYAIITDTDDTRIRLSENDFNNLTVIKNESVNAAHVTSAMNYETSVIHSEGNVDWTEVE